MKLPFPWPQPIITTLTYEQTVEACNEWNNNSPVYHWETIQSWSSTKEDEDSKWRYKDSLASFVRGYAVAKGWTGYTADKAGTSNMKTIPFNLN